MIRFRITTVAKRSSAQLNSRRYIYHQDKPRETQQFHGAEWEEVEFQLVEELEPSVGIANVDGSAYLLGDTGRILLNNPELFDKFKVGDIVHFVPFVETVESVGQEVPQGPPAAPAVAEEPIVIPKLV